MFPIRKNFYNNNIIMINYEKLIHLKSIAQESLLKKQIKNLIDLYDMQKFYLGLPYELVSYPNYFIGVLADEEQNKSLVELAIKDSMEEKLTFGLNDIIYSCGYAYFYNNFKLASEIKKIKELEILHKFISKRQLLEFVSENSLNYLLALMQTNFNLERDKKIALFSGNNFLLFNCDSQNLNYQR